MVLVLASHPPVVARRSCVSRTGLECPKHPEATGTSSTGPGQDGALVSWVWCCAVSSGQDLHLRSSQTSGPPPGWQHHRLCLDVSGLQGCARGCAMRVSTRGRGGPSGTSRGAALGKLVPCTSGMGQRGGLGEDHGLQMEEGLRHSQAGLSR